MGATHRLSLRTTTDQMVLARIIQVLSRGRASIRSLAMVPAEVTVVFDADAPRAELLASQLRRLVDVVDVRYERVSTYRPERVMPATP